jgi:hypothetical protein
MGKVRLRGSGEEEIVWFTVEVKRESSENESGDLAGMMQRRAEGTRQLQLRYDQRLEDISDQSGSPLHKIP